MPLKTSGVTSGETFGDSGRHFRFRTDLTLVEEGSRGGAGAVTLVDPRTGQQHRLSESEYFLCATADGQRSLAEIRRLQHERFGTSLTLAELFSFFRSLQVRGLLDEAGNPAVDVEREKVRNLPGLDERRAWAAGLRKPEIVKPVAPAAPNPAEAEAAVAADPARDEAENYVSALDLADLDDFEFGSVGLGGRVSNKPPPESIKPRPLPERRKRLRWGAALRSQSTDAENAGTPDETSSRSMEDSAASPPGSQSNAIAPRSLVPARRRWWNRRTEPEATAAKPDSATLTTPTQPPETPPPDAAGTLRRASRHQGRSAAAGSQEPVEARKLPQPRRRAREGLKVAPPAGVAGARPASKAGKDEPDADSEPEPAGSVSSLTSIVAVPPGHSGGPGELLAPEEFGELYDLNADVPHRRWAGGDDGVGAASGQGRMAGRGGMAGGAARGEGLGGAGGFGGGRFGGGGTGQGGGFGGAFAAGRGAAGGAGEGGRQLGPRAEALLAGLAARGRPAAQSPMQSGGPASITLFRPDGLLAVLGVLFWPLKFLHYLLLPAVLLAGMTLFQRWDAYAADLGRLAFDFTTIGKLIIGLGIVNLGTRLAQGTIIKSFGGTVPRFGIMLLYGIMPRFFIDRSAVPELDRRGQLWAYGGGLMARLTFFTLGTLLWATYRGTGSWFPELALLVGQAGMWAFLIEAMPFIPADGYRWLSTYFGQPNLRRKALGTLRAKLTGRALPAMVKPEEVPALMFFAVAGILATLGLVLGFLIYAGITLEQEFRGAGVAIFLGLILSFVLWSIALKASIGRRPRPALDPAMVQAMLAGRSAEADAAAEPEARVFSRGRVVWAIVALALLGVAFLPYQYEASGNFQILPTGRTQAAARTEGEVVEVLVREGDWVEKDQVLARLSSWEQQRDVDVTRAELEKAQADLAQLEEGPKPEQVALAERQVESARSKVTYSKAEADRFKKLVESGTISQAEWEKSNTTYETNLAELGVAEANLELVKSGSTTSQIEAAKAEVSRLTHQLAFVEDQLERANIRAPAAGRVITPNVELLGGKFLEMGNELLQIDDTRTVEAEIDVPETDISLIEPGNTVRIKAWGYTDREIPGTVTSITPAAVERDYGQVVRVKASIPNSDAFLRPAMTGYAKIEGEEMRVWEAYLRFFIRFFTVEVWSWIP